MAQKLVLGGWGSDCDLLGETEWLLQAQKGRMVWVGRLRHDSITQLTIGSLSESSSSTSCMEWGNVGLLHPVYLVM